MSHSHEPAGHHGMLLLGTKKIYACHLPMFAHKEHCYQAILEIELNSTDMEVYLNTRNENPSKPLIVMNQEPMLLKDIVNPRNNNSLHAFISFANENGDPVGEPVIESAEATVKKPLLFKELNPTGDNYPENLSYYLFGTDMEFHLSHVLTKAPNFQQELDISLDDTTLAGDKTLQDIIKGSESGPTIVSFLNVEEKNKQPILNDPLDKPEYTIRIDSDDSTSAITIKISIQNKFWINNGPLNQGFTDHIHTDHTDVHHTHTKQPNSM